jgi:uncharacterized membrane protein YdjX (TVP38/TMEM64 family)
MHRVLVQIKQHIATVLLCGVAILSLSGYVQVPEVFYTYLSTNTVIGALTVTVLMFIATVLAPIALLPMIPMIAPILGPFVTALACWLGWTAGSIVAFWIARHGGKPLLNRFVSIERIEAYQARIPEHSHFMLIFALRLVIPVDILSYALGLFSPVSMRTYTLASALGILWFSFAFSYLGQAFKNEDTVLFTTYSVVSAIIFFGALWYVRHTLKERK